MKTKIFIMFFNVCFPCYDFPYVWERKEPLAMWMKTSKHNNSALSNILFFLFLNSEVESFKSYLRVFCEIQLDSV